MWCPACLLTCCFLVIIHVQDSLQLKIKQVNIPETVKEGEVDYVILDCDYDLEGTSSKLLVVKWFFNKEGSEAEDGYLVYQWIYGNKPDADESFREYIDLQYKASDDPYTMYRAMKLNKPNIDLTGTYKCDVSTIADETHARRSMIVYSTEKKFELIHRKSQVGEKGGLEVTCLAEGLYPQPFLDISVESVPEKYSTRPVVTMPEASHYYDILTRIDLEDEDLPELTIIKCTLSIPKAKYNVSREFVYEPGTSTTTTTATTKLPRKMEIQALDNSEPDIGYGGANTASTRSLSLAFVILQVVIHLL